MTEDSRTQRLSAARPADLATAARLLHDGGTVAFPTETVYGLGAHAFRPEAVAQIFAAKGRPAWDPLIVHVCDRAMLAQVAMLRGESGRAAEALMAAFWPGPLTLLLPRTPAVPDAVTAGRRLVGVRVPAHPVAEALLRAAGVPVAAPSANRFGHTSPTTAAHVFADLDGRIDAVLDGGAAAVGLESTVAEANEMGVTVYRPGAVSLRMLEGVVGVGQVRLYRPADAGTARPESMPSPGVGIRHYAPRAELRLVAVGDLAGPDAVPPLTEEIARALAGGAKVGVMLPEDWPVDETPDLFPWGPWEHPGILAQRLFAGLRALDAGGVDVIVCPVPPGEGIARAIRDRLEKAALGA